MRAPDARAERAGRVRWPVSARLLVATLVAALGTVVSPGSGLRESQAQQNCHTFIPACPPPATFAVRVTATQDTVRTPTVTVAFSVRGVTSNLAATASVSVNGVAQPTTWFFEANQWAVTGSSTVTLSPGSNTITARFCDSADGCGTGTATAVYVAPPPPPAQGAPIVLVDAVSQRRRSVAGCAGCAYTTLSYSTPAYRSFDQDRSLTFVYSSAMSSPLGEVRLDVNPNSTTLPDRISISLLNGGTPVALLSGGTEAFYTAGSGLSRVTAAFDASAFPTGAYEMTAVVRNWWGSSMLETQTPVRVLVINQRTSGFGSGWAVAGLQRLSLPNGLTGHASIADGGTVTMFFNCGSGCWHGMPDGSDDLVSVSSTTIERRFKDGSVITFDSNTGAMTQSRDRLGNATSYAYVDPYGRLTQITDPVGQITTIAWTGAPGSTSTATITTPGGRISTVELDAAGQLVRFKDPDNAYALATSYTNNAITAATNRLNATTTFTYDRFNSLARIDAPAILIDGNPNPVSSATTFRSIEDAILPGVGLGSSGAPAARAFPDSAWLRMRTPHGDSTRVLANGAGDALKIETRNAVGKLESTSLAYNDLGQLVSLVSTSGTASKYVWTGALLTQINDLTTQVTTDLTYNAFGQPLTTSVASGLQQQNFYSANTRSVLDSSRVGNATSKFTYDTPGRLLTATDGEGHTTTLTYQASGFQNLATVAKAGKTTTLGYDSYGRPRTVTDPANRTTTTGYDLLNRVATVQAPDLTTSTWAYNDLGRMYTFTDAKSQLYKDSVNALGAVVAQVSPRGPADSVRYDADGNVSSVKTRQGRSRSVSYDLLGRPIQLSSASSGTTTIAYDTASKWVAYGNGESIDTVFVDGKGRVTRQVAVRGGQSYSLVAKFGAMGERTDLTISSSAWAGGSYPLNFGVDSLGRPNYVSDLSGQGTSIAYNKDQKPQTVTLPIGSVNNRFTETYTYGTNDLLSQQAHPLLLGVDWRYTYDTQNRLQRLDFGTTGEFTRRKVQYDAVGRLSQAADSSFTTTQQIVCTNPQIPSTCHNQNVLVGSPLRVETYTYDAVGNRTDRGAVIGTGNWLTSFDGYTMTYDNDGNLATKTGNGISQTFSWNDFGQLTAVTTNGVTTTYGYDGLGRRVRKTTNGVTTYFLYDGDNLVVQLDGNGQPQLQFSYYPGVDHPNAVSNAATGAQYYYLTSLPGHVTTLVDANGAVANSYQYTPFGQAIGTPTEAVSQPFRFTGRQFDSESGLYYYRARYYDPTLARFLSEDPRGLAGGINEYVYVGNDPQNHTDPNGMGECTSITVTVRSEDGSTKEYTARVCNSGDGYGNWFDKVVSTAVNLTDRAVTMGNTIFIPGPYDLPLLIHEFTHVQQQDLVGRLWFYQTEIGLVTLSDLAYHLHSGEDPYGVNYSNPKPYSTYTFEAQATINAACFGGSASACAITPYRFTVKR